MKNSQMNYIVAAIMMVVVVIVVLLIVGSGIRTSVNATEPKCDGVCLPESRLNECEFRNAALKGHGCPEDQYCCPDNLFTR
jgi:hypothetical protein